MPFQIVYSHRAKSEYKEIILYVVQNFGLEKAAKIDSLFEKIIFQISINPKMYPLFNKKRNIRRCVISKQTSMYYRIAKETVEIVSYRSNLMNPDTLNLNN
jgi:plasmid stabilization system protein ParE